MKEAFDLADVMLRQENEIEKQIFGILIFRKLVPFINKTYLKSKIEYLFHQEFIKCIENDKIKQNLALLFLLPWSFQD